MEEVSGIKKYHLSLEEIEAMLQTEYGNDIKPVKRHLLQKQRIQQRRQATQALNFSAKEKGTKLSEEPAEEELKEIEELEEIESL